MEEKEIIEGVVETDMESALRAEREKWEQEALHRIDLARAEGERVAGLSAEERLREREAELAGRERELLRRELKATAVQLLAGRGLPAELADALNYDDREGCERSIESVERAFRNAVQLGIAKRLGGVQPVLGCETGDAATLTDDQYYAAQILKKG